MLTRNPKLNLLFPNPKSSGNRPKIEPVFPNPKSIEPAIGEYMGIDSETEMLHIPLQPI